MAQKEKYTDDQLMDAVVRYSEACPGKIKVSELARWAAKNIPGMEGLQAHNFRTKRRTYNPRTGKPEERNLEAFDRIQELNRIREGTAHAGQNVFLHASDPDAYLRLPNGERRRQILEARKFIEQTISSDRDILRESELVQAENERLKEENAHLGGLLAKIQKEQDVLDRHLRMVIREIDEAKRSGVLRSMGVMDDGFDLVAYQAGLHQDIGDAFSVSAAIKSFTKRHYEDDGTNAAQESDDWQSQVDSIIGGIDI